MLLFLILLGGLATVAKCHPPCFEEAQACLLIAVPTTNMIEFSGGQINLNQICGLQNHFHSCILRAKSKCENFYPEDEIQKSFDEAVEYMKSVCTPGSRGRRRFLRSILCVNNQFLSYCNFYANQKREIWRDVTPRELQDMCVNIIVDANCGKETRDFYIRLNGIFAINREFRERIRYIKKDQKYHFETQSELLRVLFESLSKHSIRTHYAFHMHWMEDLKGLDSISCGRLRSKGKETFRCAALFDSFRDDFDAKNGYGIDLNNLELINYKGEKDQGPDGSSTKSPNEYTISSVVDKDSSQEKDKKKGEGDNSDVSETLGKSPEDQPCSHKDQGDQSKGSMNQFTIETDGCGYTATEPTYDVTQEMSKYATVSSRHDLGIEIEVTADEYEQMDTTTQAEPDYRMSTPDEATVDKAKGDLLTVSFYEKDFENYDVVFVERNGKPLKKVTKLTPIGALPTEPSMIATEQKTAESRMRRKKYDLIIDTTGDLAKGGSVYKIEKLESLPLQTDKLDDTGEINTNIYEVIETETGDSTVVFVTVKPPTDRELDELRPQGSFAPETGNLRGNRELYPETESRKEKLSYTPEDNHHGDFLGLNSILQDTRTRYRDPSMIVDVEDFIHDKEMRFSDYENQKIEIPETKPSEETELKLKQMGLHTKENDHLDDIVLSRRKIIEDYLGTPKRKTTTEILHILIGSFGVDVDEFRRIYGNYMAEQNSKKKETKTSTSDLKSSTQSPTPKEEISDVKKNIIQKEVYTSESVKPREDKAIFTKSDKDVAQVFVVESEDIRKGIIQGLVDLLTDAVNLGQYIIDSSLRLILPTSFWADKSIAEIKFEAEHSVKTESGKTEPSVKAESVTTEESSKLRDLWEAEGYAQTIIPESDWFMIPWISESISGSTIGFVTENPIQIGGKIVVGSFWVTEDPTKFGETKDSTKDQSGWTKKDSKHAESFPTSDIIEAEGDMKTEAESSWKRASSHIKTGEHNVVEATMTEGTSHATEAYMDIDIIFGEQLEDNEGSTTGESAEAGNVKTEAESTCKSESSPIKTREYDVADVTMTEGTIHTTETFMDIDIIFGEQSDDNEGSTSEESAEAGNVKTEAESTCKSESSPIKTREYDVADVTMTEGTSHTTETFTDIDIIFGKQSEDNEDYTTKESAEAGNVKTEAESTWKSSSSSTDGTYDEIVDVTMIESTSHRDDLWSAEDSKEGNTLTTEKSTMRIFLDEDSGEMSVTKTFMDIDIIFGEQPEANEGSTTEDFVVNARTTASSTVVDDSSENLATELKFPSTVSFDCSKGFTAEDLTTSLKEDWSIKDLTEEITSTKIPRDKDNSDVEEFITQNSANVGIDMNSAVKSCRTEDQDKSACTTEASVWTNECSEVRSSTTETSVGEPVWVN